MMVGVQANNECRNVITLHLIELKHSYHGMSLSLFMFTGPIQCIKDTPFSVSLSEADISLGSPVLDCYPNKSSRSEFKWT
jgi:hypothetical protein